MGKSMNNKGKHPDARCTHCDVRSNGIRVRESGPRVILPASCSVRSADAFQHVGVGYALGVREVFETHPLLSSHPGFIFFYIKYASKLKCCNLPSCAARLLAAGGTSHLLKEPGVFFHHVGSALSAQTAIIRQLRACCFAQGPRLRLLGLKEQVSLPSCLSSLNCSLTSALVQPMDCVTHTHEAECDLPPDMGKIPKITNKFNKFLNIRNLQTHSYNKLMKYMTKIMLGIKLQSSMQKSYLILRYGYTYFFLYYSIFFSEHYSMWTFYTDDT